MVNEVMELETFQNEVTPTLCHKEIFGNSFISLVCESLGDVCVLTKGL